MTRRARPPYFVRSGDRLVPLDGPIPHRSGRPDVWVLCPRCGQPKRHRAPCRCPGGTVEADFQAAVVELLSYAGFAFWFHDNDARRNNPGLPDLLALRAPDPRWTPRMLFCELKGGPQGRLRPGRWADRSKRWLPGQDEWRVALRAICASFGTPGPEYYLWTPADMERIKAVLWEGYPHGLAS